MPNLNGEGPDAREGHTAVLVDKRLFIFGGCGKSVTHEEKYFNDLYILDTGKFSQSIFLNFVMFLGINRKLLEQICMFFLLGHV